MTIRLIVITGLTCAALDVTFCQDDFWPQTNGPFAGTVQGLAVSQSGRLFAATNAGVFYSDNSGNSWALSDSNTSLANFICVTPQGMLFILRGSSMSRSTNDGRSWYPLPGVGFTSLTTTRNGILFAGTNDGMLRSTDNGDSWLPVNNGIADLAVNSVTVNSNDYIFIGTGNEEAESVFGGVYRSTNAGESWIQINNGLSPPTVHHVAAHNSFHVFASAGYFSDVLFRSITNGDQWHSSIGFHRLNRVAFDSDGNVYACEVNGLHRSTDFGENWSRIAGIPSANDLVEDVHGSLFVGSEDGIRISTDRGATWFQKNNGLIGERIPQSFSLFQNYPNPFNATTTISFSIPEPTSISIDLFDLLGKHVSTVTAGFFTAGVHRIAVSADNLASGFYMYRLSGIGFIESRKMMVLR